MAGLKSSLILTASIVAHGALAMSVAGIGTERIVHGATTISMAEKKKPPPPPTPLDPLPERPKDIEPLKRAARAKSVAAPKEAPAKEAKVNAAAGALDALPDFGLSLGNGTGPGGFAVPTGGSGGDPTESRARAAAPTGPLPTPTSECTEAVVKPKPIAVPQPAYTNDARQAGITGRVRVEITVNDAGRVTGVRLLSGLGHGLDEAALAAARSATFVAATRCGKPVGATFVVAMRFSL